MLNLIIADAELEQVPEEIAKHRVIQWHARRKGKRPTEMLLNSSLHHAATRRLHNGDRRGRPDIVHMCLLLALDTPLNRENLLRAYVHTRHHKLIIVDPAARLPRMFNRFEGLLEHLFLAGKAPPEKPLLRLKEASLASLVKQLQPKKVITFSDRGNPQLLRKVFTGLSGDDDICAIVGGFPKGDFLSNVNEISDEVVSIDPELLRAPTVVARAIHAYEETLGIPEARQDR